MKLLNLAISLALATMAVANPAPNPLKIRNACIATGSACLVAFPEICCSGVCRFIGGDNPDIGVSICIEPRPDGKQYSPAFLKVCA